MGRIVVSENMTLDGVIEDGTGEEGFAFGGWFAQMPDADRQEWAAIEYQEALDSAAWLIGRGSYEWFAPRWADRPGEWADQLRSLPKYVVSSTLDAATAWENSIVLGGDVLEQVRKLKETVDGDILVYASGPLVHTLLDHDLVDELRLMIHPFVLGTGKRLFGALAESKRFRPVSLRTVGDSVVLLTYRSS